MRKLCVILSCLLFCAVIPLCAQTNLGSVDVGSSATTTATVTTAGTANYISVVTGGAADLDYTDAGGETCTVGTVYAASATCTVQVKFAPRYAGARYGAVVLNDGNGNTLATAYMQGTGIGPQSSFLPGTQTIETRGFNSAIFAPAGLAVDASGRFYYAEGLFNPYSGPGPGDGNIEAT